MRILLVVPAVLSLLPAAVVSDELPPSRYLELKLEADARWETGDREGALPLYQRLHAVHPADGDLAFRLARGLVAAGRLEEALPLTLAALESGFAAADRTAYSLAQAAAQEGDAEAALAWLERALAEGWDDRPGLQTDEAFATLAGTARFRELAGFAPDGLEDRVAGWRHDLAFFVEEAQRLHADPARRAFDEGFLTAVASLTQSLPKLDDVAVAMELQRIVTTWLADGHSVLYPMPTERVDFGGMLPVSFYFFPDGLYVVGAEAGREELVGMRVDAIGGRSTATLEADLEVIVSRDNTMGIRWIGPLYLRGPATLRALGYVDTLGPVTLTLTGRGGSTREVTLEPAPPRAMNERLTAPPGVAAPRWLARADEAYWHETLPELDAVYLQLNQVNDAREGPSLSELALAVRDSLRDGGATTLIVDLRHNSGGNNFLLWPIVRLAGWHGLAGEGHRTFVITGRNTFSAAQNLVNFLERATDAVFVGEHSSSKPNFAGESTNVQLPWSGVRMSLSSRWWQDSYPGDERPYIPVSMPVELTFEDWSTGRDPVMEALAQVLGEDGPPEAPMP